MDGLDRDIAWVKSSLSRLESAAEALRKDVSDIRELVLRHDEQLKAAQTRQTWLGVVLAGTLMAMVKNWLHL